MGLVYFPKFTIKNQPHVGKYAIHGWFWFQCCTGDVVFVPLISAPKTKKTRWETNIYVPWAVIADGSISLTWQSIYDSLTFLSISFPYHFPSTPFRSISSRLSSKSPSNQISTISSTTSPKKTNGCRAPPKIAWKLPRKKTCVVSERRAVLPAQVDANAALSQVGRYLGTHRSTHRLHFLRAMRGLDTWIAVNGFPGQMATRRHPARTPVSS